MSICDDQQMLGKRINGGDASGRTLIEKRMWIHPI